MPPDPISALLQTTLGIDPTAAVIAFAATLVVGAILFLFAPKEN